MSRLQALNQPNSQAISETLSLMKKTSNNSVKLVSMILSQRIDLKKAAIFMASITLFSFFPILTPLFLQLCTSSLSFFNLFFLNYSSERNYMFLFCNGILAFVIKNSVLISSNAHLGNGRISSVHHHPTTSHEHIITEKKSFDQEYQKAESSHGEEETLEMKNGFEEKDEEEEDSNPVDEEDEDEDEDENGDELNKKCEDFIRRMRQGIRIEANQEMFLDHKRRRSYDFH